VVPYYVSNPLFDYYASSVAPSYDTGMGFLSIGGTRSYSGLFVMPARSALAAALAYSFYFSNCNYSSFFGKSYSYLFLSSIMFILRTSNYSYLM